MISIQLDQTPPHYNSGTSITGELTWSDLPANCNALKLRLFWYTSGKGDRDIETVASRQLLKPGPKGKQRFEFSSPIAPYSFSGKLISLSWGLEAVPLPDGEGHMVELVIGPGAREIQLAQPGEPLT